MKKMENGCSLDGQQNDSIIYSVYTYDGYLTRVYVNSTRPYEDIVDKLSTMYKTSRNKCRIYMRRSGESRPGILIYGKKYACDK